MNIAPHSQFPAWWPWWEEWMWNGTEALPQLALLPKVMPCNPVMPAACPEARPVGILTSFAPQEVAMWVLRLLCSRWAWNCATVSSLVAQFLPSLSCRFEKFSVLLLERSYWNKDVYGSPCPSGLSRHKPNWGLSTLGVRLQDSLLRKSSALCELGQV